MGEAKRRRQQDPNYGNNRSDTPLLLTFTLVEPLPDGTYLGTATFNGRRFNLQWYGESSGEPQRVFNTISEFLLPKAREILRYYRNIEGIYGWEAVIENQSLQVTIKTPAPRKVFDVQNILPDS
ncbi:hypothetical protein SD80_003895 [Scytonema tolypothrichoides VB-61278]|nr:hypothetical protein SD80_003895 [Scytonema tolypothrichoides VB-61278]